MAETGATRSTKLLARPEKGGFGGTWGGGGGTRLGVQAVPTANAALFASFPLEHEGLRLLLGRVIGPPKSFSSFFFGRVGGPHSKCTPHELFPLFPTEGAFGFGAAFSTKSSFPEGPQRFILVFFRAFTRPQQRMHPSFLSSPFSGHRLWGQDC